MLSEKLCQLFDSPPADYSAAHFELFKEFISLLNEGKIRACEPTHQGWKLNPWVKKGILVGFRMGHLAAFPDGEKLFFDKHTIAARQFTLADQVRLVPGGSSVRNGAYIAAGVTVMPPAFINIGAYVDTGSMVDSHALVGSCAQIGKNVHLSAGAMIGGVLEPIGSRPVIVEDQAFIGGNTGIYEGVFIGSRSVIASGTILTASTPVFDATQSRFLPLDADGAVSIPPNAVVVPGSRKLSSAPDYQIYTPIIIKYRDAKTDSSVALESCLRQLLD